MYLIGGNGGPDGSFLNDVWFSTNGAAWTEKTNAPFPPRADHASVIKDGYLYVIGGVNTGWNNPNILADVWCTYIGGSDLNFNINSSASYAIPQLTLTNNGTYPIKEIYIYQNASQSMGNNRLSSNLGASSSTSITLDSGTYCIYVKDTQNRNKVLSAVIYTSNVSQSISSSGWTSPPAPQTYTYSVKNNHDYEITGVYIRSKGTSGWGSNRGSYISAGANAVSVGQFEAGLYDIKIVSKIKLQTGGGSSAGSRRPATTGSGSIVTTYPERFLYFEGDNLNAAKTLQVNKNAHWTSELK
jgi:hypothetical protein